MVEVTRATSVDIREAWPNEARDFTPWLAEHLEWLAEDLNLGPLDLEATEVAIPDGRSLDILAVDADGQAVAIENQYGVSDHDHLTRGLAYAVALQASDRPVSALVVVAESYRDEFVAVADYLNECAAARGEQGIRIFLASVKLEQARSGPTTVRFTPRAEPNNWEAAARREGPQRLRSTAELVARLEPAGEEKARWLLDWWDSQPGCWAEPASTSLALYAQSSRSSRNRCHVASIWEGGAGVLWLNPGRLQEAGALSEDDLEDLEERMTRSLPPTTTAGGKGKHFAFPLSEIEPESAEPLLRWLLERLANVDSTAR